MHTATRSALAAALAVLTAAAGAQAPADFPAAATMPPADAIKSHLGGNVFGVSLADGSTWRLQFTAAGYFFVNTSAGFSNNGTWNAEDGKLCSTFRGNATTTCNDVRLHDGVLLLRRASGEIIRYVPK